MIVNLEKFIAEERPKWEQLGAILDRQAQDPWRRLSLAEARELERLYRRASADLARLATFSAEPETREYLERLVARGYAEIYGTRNTSQRFRPWHWLIVTWPTTFRRHWRAFQLCIALTLVGVVFGGAAIAFDPGAKQSLMPFSHLQGDPRDRVAREESGKENRIDGHQASFSAELMSHNIQVTIDVVALGMTYGVGSAILLFYNGVILGAVAVDYILAGEGTFLAGWLLPHGTIEIPAILVGGQAAFVLAGALLGHEVRKPLWTRMRVVVPDVATLCGGAAVMLVWAGFVESFLSQHHQPVVPYWAKITFGVIEVIALTWFLRFSGRSAEVKQT